MKKYTTMKLNEILKTLEFVVYCDLDGVLVDFESHAYDITGINISTANRAQTKKFWKDINKWTDNDKPFFVNMKPLPDAFKLWSFIEKYHPIILSSYGDIKNAADEKREWVRKHLGAHVANEAIFVKQSVLKAEYAAPMSILIDDQLKSINPWIQAGGIGILHKSADLTIKQLKDII